jgi:hypothetical protein
MFDSTVSAKAIQVQRDAAEVAALFGEGVGAPLPNEGDEAYTRRVLAGMQRHSPKFQYSNFDSQSSSYLADTFEMVRSDAIENFKRPEGQLRSAVSTDGANRRITRWFGDPHEAWQKFCPPPQYARIREELGKGGHAPRAKCA